MQRTIVLYPEKKYTHLRKIVFLMTFVIQCYLVKKYWLLCYVSRFKTLPVIPNRLAGRPQKSHEGCTSRARRYKVADLHQSFIFDIDIYISVSCFCNSCAFLSLIIKKKHFTYLLNTVEIPVLRLINK